jgi:hypothetical protein
LCDIHSLRGELRASSVAFRLIFDRLEALFGEKPSGKG